MAFVALSNPPLQRLNATPFRARVGVCRDAARWRARLLAAVVRSNATLAFTAERQVVGRIGEGRMTKRTYAVGASTLTLEFGDLTKSAADVLVSSDDSYITMGGGVSAAILRVGGETVLIDAAKKVPARLGDVVVTAAGLLPAKHIFHAITIGDGDLPPKEIVSNATRRCFELLDSLGLKSIAFPAIGAGLAGFSYREVAGHMADTIVEALSKSPRKVETTLYLFDRFSRMQPIDFITFFEEFAVRTNRAAVAPASAASRRQTPRPAGRREPRQERRKESLQELARLEGERQALERTLATVDGALTRRESIAIERRLRDVHQERLKVLAAVKPVAERKPVSVFVSYSHADERLRKDLGKHLSSLERQGLISAWHDRMIGAGTEWEGAIDERLEKAHVILLLVSSDFVTSKYCYDIEMTRALERHESREALVVPIVLRPVVMRGLPFSKIQALPRDARPVTDWPNLDSALVEVTEGLRDAIEGLAGETAQPGIAAVDRLPRSARSLARR